MKFLIIVAMMWNQKLSEIVKEELRDYDPGHDYAHTLRVRKTALELSEEYEDCNRDLVDIAACLHDVGDGKFFKRKKVERRTHLQEIMRECEVPEEIHDDVLAIVMNISYSGRNPDQLDSPEYFAVRDADRLEAIGAIGVARAFSYGGTRGAPFYDAENPRNPETTIGHFYQKLLVVKDGIAGDKARKMAEERHAFLLQFLREFEKEINN